MRRFYSAIIVGCIGILTILACRSMGLAPDAKVCFSVGADGGAPHDGGAE
jgi:hypothetical protein